MKITPLITIFLLVVATINGVAFYDGSMENGLGFSKSAGAAVGALIIPLALGYLLYWVSGRQRLAGQIAIWVLGGLFLLSGGRQIAAPWLPGGVARPPAPVDMVDTFFLGVVDQITADLPLRVDEVTRLQRVTYADREMVYYFVIDDGVDLQVNDGLIAEMHSHAKRGVLENPQTQTLRDMCLNNGRHIRYVYSHRGVEVFQYRVL